MSFSIDKWAQNVYGEELKISEEQKQLINDAVNLPAMNGDMPLTDKQLEEAAAKPPDPWYMKLYTEPYTVSDMGSWAPDTWTVVDTNWYWDKGGGWRRSTGPDSDIFVSIPKGWKNKKKVIKDFDMVTNVVGNPIKWDGKSLIATNPHGLTFYLNAGDTVNLSDNDTYPPKELYNFTISDSHIPTYLPKPTPTATITNSEPIHFDLGDLKFAEGGVIQPASMEMKFESAEALVAKDLLQKMNEYGGSYPKTTVTNEAPQQPQTQTKTYRVYIEALRAYKLVAYRGNMKMEAVIGKPDLDWFVEQKDFFGGAWTSFWLSVRKCMSDLDANKPGDGSYWQTSRIPLMAKIVKHPVLVKDDGEPFEFPLVQTITDLNDHHKWTREQIADWLDTLDEQPVFYPRAEFESVGNSAFLVTLQPPIPCGAKDGE